jgi:hypothetical protein
MTEISTPPPDRHRAPGLGGRARSMKPVVTRIERRHITVAAQSQRGVRVDIGHITEGGDELHLEAYDYHGRKVEAVMVDRGDAKHPEIVLRLVPVEPTDG